MYSKMNTKFIAVLAVFAMAFAGFGAMAVADDNDAATADKDLVITFKDAFDPDVLKLMINGILLPDDTTSTPKVYYPYAKYIAERNAVEPTVDNIDDYKLYIKPFAAKGIVTIPFEIMYFINAGTDLKKALVGSEVVEGTTTTMPTEFASEVVDALASYYDVTPVKVTVATKEYYVINAEDDFKLLKALDIDDMISMLAVFADVKTTTSGDILSGLDTQITVPACMDAKTEITFVDETDAEAAIAFAVAAAIAQEEAKYADYKSPEQVTAAIDAAVAIVKEQYKDWSSPDDVKKACQAAVEQYILDHPTKDDATLAWCVAAVGIIAAIVLAGFLVFVFYKANKNGWRLI